ncbi:GNAT family N-acetyltransferase [Peribacillus acanthi]|uniref:GNAT family N-acetyltransferase n=1 Tax=Peribacillus acanthi TaxID=2171554 RepID=UPI000D3E782B|nr:GNAT family N-acetyltransferase [Peribacillus acanthi]
MDLLPLSELREEQIKEFFIQYWGSTEMVLSTGVYDCLKLEGFAVQDEYQSLVGLLTFIMKDKECEIVSLDSVIEGKGIGSRLMHKVEGHARTKGCRSIKLITTNDNLHALGFYQKRGYVLTKLYPDVVKEARKIKPEIPLVSENGIPIRDELLLEKSLV